MHSGTIDLLLTDVIMPDMDGPTLAASFGHLRVGAPILFISGYAADALNFAAPASGTIRMLSKPFSVDELTRHVRAALASGQTAKKEAQDQDPARLSRNA
jgi:two-component system cell cycle sensor histidine kinase/response regulator CckA